MKSLMIHKPSFLQDFHFITLFIILINETNYINICIYLNNLQEIYKVNELFQINTNIILIPKETCLQTFYPFLSPIFHYLLSLIMLPNNVIYLNK